jgi:hypothetical protein
VIELSTFEVVNFLLFFVDIVFDRLDAGRVLSQDGLFLGLEFLINFGEFLYGLF